MGYRYKLSIPSELGELRGVDESRSTEAGIVQAISEGRKCRCAQHGDPFGGRLQGCRARQRAHFQWFTESVQFIQTG